MLMMCADVQRSVEVSQSLQDLYEDKDTYVSYFVLVGVSVCVCVCFFFCF